MTVTRCAVLGCVAMAFGCGEDGTVPDAADLDAGTADGFVDPWAPEPVSISGSTPIGSAEMFRYIHARYASYWCGHKYQIELTPTELRDNASLGPYLLIEFPMAVDAVAPLTGVVSADVRLADASGTLERAMSGVFEATVVDPPSIDNARVSGRVVVNEMGWTLDFVVDLTSRGSYTCN